MTSRRSKIPGAHYDGRSTGLIPTNCCSGSARGRAETRRHAQYLLRRRAGRGEDLCHARGRPQKKREGVDIVVGLVEATAGKRPKRFSKDWKFCPQERRVSRYCPQGVRSRQRPSPQARDHPRGRARPHERARLPPQEALAGTSTSCSARAFPCIPPERAAP